MFNPAALKALGAQLLALALAKMPCFLDGYSCRLHCSLPLLLVCHLHSLHSSQVDDLLRMGKCNCLTEAVLQCTPCDSCADDTCAAALQVVTTSLPQDGVLPSRLLRLQSRVAELEAEKLHWQLPIVNLVSDCRCPLPTHPPLLPPLDSLKL